MRRRSAVAAVFALCVAMSGPADSQPATLIPIDLGVLPGGTYSIGYGINDNGQVTGVADTAAGEPHAFLWERGAMTDLGSLGGSRILRTFINKRGQVAGNGYTATGETHGFSWSEGTLVDLGTLGGAESVVTAINNRGQIVGYSTVPAGELHAFLFENGVMTDLGTPGETSRALDINERGAIAGAITSGFRSQAVVWDRGTVVELGTLPGGHSSSAVGINQRGEVVGDADIASGAPRSFYWRAGTMVDIGIATVGDGSLALAIAINDRGQIIGLTDASGRTRGYFWDDGVIVPLRIFGSFSAALALNNHGQVVGQAFDGNDDLGFVWEGGQFRVLAPIPGNSGSIAVAINKRGEAAGSSGFGRLVSRAVIWETKKSSPARLTP